jgi:hypothetical protein
MLKSMEPKYRSEAFESAGESTAMAETRDLIDWLRSIRRPASSEAAEDPASRAIHEWRRNQSWPVIEYAISRRCLWEEIWAPAMAVGISLLLVFGEIDPQIRAKLLFGLTMCWFLLPPALGAVARALLPKYQGSVRLESDGLVFDPGLARAPRTIRYEQIWDVDVQKSNKAVTINYYAIGFGGQIDEGRVTSLSVNFVQNAEELASELGKRACGVTRGHSVRVKQIIKSILRMFAWLLIFGVAWVETMMVFAILTALKYL